MVHRADVLKDRTWALNGRTFRWLDKAKYETGDSATSAAMVNAAREPLHGEVEIDDTWIGGPQAGLRGVRTRSC